LVDATQGVEAQTLANAYQAIDADHEIVVVLNKIDLPAAEPEQMKEQIEDILGLDASAALLISAKTGDGVDEVMEAIVQRLPPPAGDVEAPLKALVVDSWYDPYLGVVTLIRVKEGRLEKGMRARFMGTGAVHPIDRVGVFSPKPVVIDDLGPGEVGFITAGIKDIVDAQVGDTITDDRNPADAPLPGFRPSQPVVFCGMFPADGADYPALRDALGKLRLNDSSFDFEPENSQALGFGFRCGFLGLLHLEIIQARLDREFDLDLVLTAPSVVYRLHKRDGTVAELHNPADYPDPTQIEFLEEPWIKATIILPDEFLGPVLQLCTEKRGIQDELTYVGQRAMLVYRLPLNEVVYDFYDRLKSLSRGYASFDYEMVGFDRSDLVKLDILINGDRVDSLALLVHRSMAEARGRALCERLQELIPRQQYQVAIQAAIGGKVIARETVKAMRKDVLAKCYGGDVTRKRKLLEKQKAGKKRMRQFGKIEIPQEAFLAALKMET
jgi:GTP-binding protein LepA